MAAGNELFTPIKQERIRQGSMVLSVLFKVRYPDSDHADYDYIAMDVYDDFDHLNLGKEKMVKLVHKVFPNATFLK